MIINYNKLVRDRIPEIIESSGKTCTTEILSPEKYLRMLDAKLDEELAEYHEDQSIEELADLLEVIHAAAVARGYTLEDLEQIRAEKAAKRGGFEKRILLKTVVDSSEPDSLIERICMNKAAILEKISPSMLEKYCWLEENLNKCDLSISTEYQRRFAHYYRMRFVSKEYRRAFLTCLSRSKTTEARPLKWSHGNSIRSMGSMNSPLFQKCFTRLILRDQSLIAKSMLH